MCDKILKQYEKAKADILSDRPRCYHYPLLSIMRTVTADLPSKNNLPLLTELGIDPEEFGHLWDLGYAKETLGGQDNDLTRPPFAWLTEVTINRCKISLQANSLPDDIQGRLRANLEFLERPRCFNS